MSIMKKIREKAKSLPVGKPVTSKAFMSLGKRAAVDQALSRLVKEGVLSRPTRGVYLRPKRSVYVGEVSPEPIKVAEAIASESSHVVQVQGAEAARQMGLTTQVPIKPVFYTSGPNHRFRLGALEVALKHVSPRKLALAGRPAGVALAALWYQGKKHVNVETIKQIEEKLAPKEFELLCSEASSMPGWMHDVVIRYKEKLQNA